MLNEENKAPVNSEVNETASNQSTAPNTEMADLKSQVESYKKMIDELKDMINLKFDDLMSARREDEHLVEDPDRPDDPEMVTLDEMDDDELPVG